MPDPSSSPKLKNGNPAATESSKPQNNAAVFVAGIPAWWHPGKIPDKVKRAVDFTETLIGPEAYTERPRNGMVLHGPPGTGKTSTGCALLFMWGTAGHRASFQDFGELMLKIRSAWRKDAAQTTEQIMAAMMEPRILLLDDVGKRATPEDQETLSVLVNGRINRGKPTLLTTNCNLDTTEGRAQFSAACDSRTLERMSNCEILVEGDNLRRIG